MGWIQYDDWDPDGCGMVNGDGDHDDGDDRETEEDSHLHLLLLEPAHDHR